MVPLTERFPGDSEIDIAANILRTILVDFESSDLPTELPEGVKGDFRSNTVLKVVLFSIVVPPLLN